MIAYVIRSCRSLVVLMRIKVLDRVMERHPELSDEKDVVTAFRSVMVDAERESGAWIAIGLDDRARRNVEMLYRVVSDLVVITTHAARSTKKFRTREIDRLRGDGRNAMSDFSGNATGS
jgi:hypothetical protein